MTDEDKTRTVMVTGEVALTMVQRLLDRQETHMQRLAALDDQHAALTGEYNQETTVGLKELADAMGVDDYDPGKWTLDVTYFDDHGVAVLKPIDCAGCGGGNSLEALLRNMQPAGIG